MPSPKNAKRIYSVADELRALRQEVTELKQIEETKLNNLSNVSEAKKQPQSPGKSNTDPLPPPAMPSKLSLSLGTYVWSEIFGATQFEHQQGDKREKVHVFFMVGAFTFSPVYWRCVAAVAFYFL
jgi:hypothetical protein